MRFLFRVSDIASHTFASGSRRDLTVLDERTGEVSPSGLICSPVTLSSGLSVYVEGRPDQIVNGKGHDALLPVDRLPEVDSVIRENLSRMGVDLLPAATEIGRIDTTASLELGSRPEMQAALRAVEVSPPPRRRVNTYRKRGVLESCEFRGMRGPKVYERVYAEGPTHGSGRERFLRLEAQKRYQSRDRLPLSEWTPDRAADTFARSFAAHRERLGIVTVGNLDALADDLLRLHREGEITANACETLLGYLWFRHRGDHVEFLSDRTMRRRESELARLGLSFDPDVSAPFRLDLQNLMDRATGLSWGSCG